MNIQDPNNTANINIASPDPDPLTVTCPECDGSGYQPDPDAAPADSIFCEVCHAQGRINADGSPLVTVPPCCGPNDCEGAKA